MCDDKGVTIYLQGKRRKCITGGGHLGGAIIRPAGIIGVLCISDYPPPILYIRSPGARVEAMRTSENRSYAKFTPGLKARIAVPR
jgi:hypothetical protein